ncbi:ABC transporter substrate-binding protein [Nocardioides abyssi]|uniref:ABC transporter substrate-binding protein n=1 Tax=Nocardioides abyssi TaxID=3058370 RepID=A0ABT8ER61_9ACTN|nr:ABC transporter substrate-binding protein [Nocardioides abyssi]MDN4160607.1 ABC transporter substrate-binding protein [Nocardioides abyssi]
MTTTGARAATAALGAALALVLAGCGSQVAPATVSQVTGTGALAPGAAGPDDAGTGTGTDPTGVTGGGPIDTGAGSAAGSGDVSSGGTTSSGTGSGPGGASGGGAGGAAGEGGPPAADPGQQGSCDGFANTTGVTDEAITLANVSDISGPVPGVFQAAQDGARAFAAYFNATSDICGRAIEVMALDSRADSAANQVAYTKACDEAFAAVGSMSVFDDGGAATAQGCGLPDLHALSVSQQVFECDTCFGTAAVTPDLQPLAVPQYLRTTYGAAADKVGVLYINVGTVPLASKRLAEAWEKGGLGVDYVQAIDVAEFNYAPYVQELKNRGIELVTYVGPYQHTIRMQQAMQQQGYRPKAFIQDQTIYDQTYVEEAGAAGEGTLVYTTTALLDDLRNKEVALYRSWLEQVRPGAVATIYGAYAWSATRLFVEQANRLGGRLTRASLVGALRKVSGWTGNGLHSPQQVGSKRSGDCMRFIQLDGGRWKQVSSGDYVCGDLVKVS